MGGGGGDGGGGAGGTLVGGVGLHPFPSTHSTSWFSQKLCFSDRTMECPLGPGARGPKTMPTEDGGLGVWGGSQGGRRLESRGGVGLALGQKEVATRAGGEVQVAECGGGRRGDPALQLVAGQVSGPGEASAGFRRRQERGSQSPRAAVPRPLQVLHGCCVPGSSLWATRHPHGVLSLSSCSLPPMGLPDTSLACDHLALISAYWSHLLLLHSRLPSVGPL